MTAILLAIAIAWGSHTFTRDAPAQRPAPSRLLVHGFEFGLTVSRAKLKPGPAIVQFVNRGEDPHDLRVARTGDAVETGLGEIEPGEYGTLQTRLRRRSTYVMWCSLADHRELGMEARVRTSKRRRP